MSFNQIIGLAAVVGIVIVLVVFNNNATSLEKETVVQDKVTERALQVEEKRTERVIAVETEETARATVIQAEKTDRTAERSEFWQKLVPWGGSKEVKTLPNGDPVNQNALPAKRYK